MAVKTETAKAQVLIDGKEAAYELEVLKKKTKELKAEMDKAFKSGDKDLWKKLKGDSDELDKSIKKVKAATVDVTAVLKNLNGTNLKTLNAAQKQITTELSSMTRGTKEYIAASANLQKVEAEISKVKTEMHGVSTAGQNMWSKTANGFNKYFTLFTAAAASLTGVIFGFKKLVSDFNDYEKKIANLSALTGLAGDDLTWLSDKAKELSTSVTDSGVKITSSSDDIVDAFTKMGSAKPELLKDKDALALVTEQALILKEASQGELEPTVESLANTMNQFSADASEAARYVNVLAAGSKEGSAEVQDISDSIVKFGAAAGVANVSVEESVALIETLAEKGIKGEIAGRGLKGMLLELMSGADATNPKVVGLNTALENLKAQHLSAAEMVKRFGQENYMAAQIITANSERVDYFTKAVTGSNVAVEQAITNTSTNSAKLEQAKNKAHLMALELGEKLAPALTFSTNAFTYFMKAIMATINFYKEHSREINSVIVGITAYTVATKAAAIIEGVFSGALKIATTAMKIFNATMKGNPWTLIVSGITAVVSYLVIFKDKLDDAALAQQALNDASVEAKKKMIEENYQLALLLKTAKDDTLSKEERLKAIKSINAISPEYLGNITLEKVNTEDTTKAIEKYTKALEDKYLAEVLNEKIKEEMAKQLEIENSTIEDNISWYEKLWNSIKSGGSIVNTASNNISTSLENQKEKLDESKNKVSAYEEKLNELKKTTTDLTSANKDNTDGTKENVDAKTTTIEKVKEETDAYKKLTSEISNYEALKKEAITEGNIELANNLDIVIKKLTATKDAIDLISESWQKASNKGEIITTLQNDYIEKFKKKNEDYKLAFSEISEYYDKLTAQATEFGSSVGSAIGEAINNGESLAKAAGKAMLQFWLKQLKNYAEIKIAEATIGSLTTADSIATFGTTGVIRAAILTGLIEAAYGTISTVISQAATGKYPVIGASDGKRYNASVSSDTSTRLLTQPTILAGEQMPEWIIDGPTTKRMMDYPGLVNAIYSLSGRVPQYAAGKYPAQTNATNAPIISSDPNMLLLLKEISEKLNNPTRAKVVLSDLEKVQEKVQDTKNRYNL